MFTRDILLQYTLYTGKCVPLFKDLEVTTLNETEQKISAKTVHKVEEDASPRKRYETQRCCMISSSLSELKLGTSISPFLTSFLRNDTVLEVHIITGLKDINLMNFSPQQIAPQVVPSNQSCIMLSDSEETPQS